MPNSYWPFPSIIGFIVLLNGIIIYARDSSRRLNQLFLLETIIIFFWALANSLVILDSKLLWLSIPSNRLTYIIGFPIAPTFALLSCYLPKADPPRKWQVAFSIGVSIVIISIPAFTNILDGPITLGRPANRTYLLTYLLFFVGFVLHGLGKIEKKIKRAKNPLEKKQLIILQRGLLIAFTIGIFSGLITPMFLPNARMLNLTTVLATFIFALFTSYTIIKYGFMAPLPFAMGQIFESFYLGIMITDFDGIIVKSNRALADLLDLNESMEGKSSDELADTLALRIETLISNGDEREAFRAWFSGEEDGEKEFTFGDHNKRVLLVTKSTVEDSHGYPVGRIFTFLDNTERRRLTRELQESRDHLEGLLENANDIILTCDKAGRIMSANKMAVKVSGMKSLNLYGRNVYSMIAPDDVKRTRNWADNWVLGKQTESVLQLEFISASGEKIPVETSLNVIEFNGEVVGVQAIARDLRPRIEAEHRIRKLQELNQQIIRNAPIGIATVDEKGVFTSINPAFSQIMGYDSANELLGRNFLEFSDVERFHLGEPLQEVLSGTTTERALEFTTVRTGKHVNIKAFGTPLLSEHEEVQGALIIIADLSREKELERQLIQSEKLSSIGKLISGVAHELNNPLTAIMGYSQFLSLNEEMSEKSLEMAGKIQTSAERCKKIVANLLGYARRKPPEKSEVDINEMLNKTLELREYDFKVSNISIQKIYQPDLHRTAGDPDQLQQVFLNVINNAFDAIREVNGRGELKIRTYETPDKFINIEFIDDGPGVEESLQDKIFDPFFTTKPVGKGTGLGLSLSYGIMRAHGGFITLDRSHRNGAKFVVGIPIEPVEKESEQAYPEHKGLTDSDFKRVLLVDDEEQILECTKLLLENNLYRVTTASSGEEAKKELETADFDVIVTDLRMPGKLDGRALYKLILEEKPNLARKVIFITGDTLDNETDHFLRTVPNRHVKKPFTTQELISSITEIVRLA